MFIESGDAALRDISAALGRGDLAAIGSAAHSFKGSSASIRAQSVSAAAGELEDAARAGATDQLPSWKSSCDGKPGARWITCARVRPE